MLSRRAAVVGAAVCVQGGAWAAARKPFRLALLGDSLVTGYGLSRQDAIPARLQSALRRRGVQVEVLDAGVSGETSTQARRRLGSMLNNEDVDGVLIVVGANDLLQEISPSVLEQNLDAMVTSAQSESVAVAIAGMRAPSFYGMAYQRAFDQTYGQVAHRRRAPLYPFFLDGVALNPAFNLPDRVHPNAAGAQIIAMRLAPFVLTAFGLTPQ